MATFSQRHGYSKVRTAIVREDAPSELRIALWNVLNICIWNRWEPDSYHRTPISQKINFLIGVIWLHYFKADFDTVPQFQGGSSRPPAYEILKDHVLTGKWFQVFDFLEFLAKQPDSLITDEIRGFLNDALAKESSAYRLVDAEIVEMTDSAQIEAIEQALQVNATGVKIHLKAALSLLSDRQAPDYRNSIKESISAVEAACREVAGVPTATLGDALKKLKGLHPALQKAFLSLYGFTSDSSGIRHALLEESSLTKDDATFMLVVCSAFTGYLLSAKKD